MINNNKIIVTLNDELNKQWLVIYDFSAITIPNIPVVIQFAKTNVQYACATDSYIIFGFYSSLAMT